MEKEPLSQVTVEQIFSLTPVLTTLPMAKLWIDYDREVDVLYVSFKRPQHATHSDMLENGVLLNYRGKEVVGMTVFEASTRVPATSAQ
jgi:uncharacterized protein YuzE